MRYIRYARKSEPDEGRQEKSIEQQRAIMLQDAERLGLCIVKEIDEAVSAKTPGKRQGYREMVLWLQKGKADAILVYHENRLSRNPLESGELQQLLQDGIIKEIRTHETVYRPEDNALLFAVISSMSNQYSRDLSNVVQRAMNSKRAEGWFPHRAPEGYFNNTYDHTIAVDEKRFPVLRKAWDLILTGSYSVSQVLDILNNEWGYKTRVLRNSGGGPLSRTALYNIFGNVFYTGRWMEKGVLYEGKHKPMVSAHEFNLVQEIMGRHNKAQRKVHEFAYTGLICCAVCGCTVTAELQRGRHGRGTYIYYHCSNSRGLCSRKSISEKSLEKQLDELLHRITIEPAVREIVLEEIRGWQKSQSTDTEMLYQQQQKALLDAERRMSRLVQMYLNDLFDSDEEYKKRKAEMQKELNGLRLAVKASEQEFERITQTAENAFGFASQSRERFLIGSIGDKREIARALGINYSFQEGMVTIDLHPALAAVCQFKGAVVDNMEYQVRRTEIPQQPRLKMHCIEPLKSGSRSKKDGSFEPSVSLGWPSGTLYETFRDIKEYFPRLSWMETPQQAPLQQAA
jgi:DNA invertase Pin-like site-specific DNA recombinase